MDMRRIERFLNTYGLHILMVFSGLILLLNPDGAMALVTKIVGWILVIGCAVRLISLATGNQLRWGRDAFFTGAALCVGVVLLARPLILANLIGRVFGILLLIEGFRNFRTVGFRLTTVLTIAAGFVLLIMPRTLTHTLLAICGIVMIVIGVVNILGRTRDVGRYGSGNATDIIDADQ